MMKKIQQDKEKARSILKMIGVRERFVKNIDNTEFPTIAAENYYEIIKELATGILLIEGCQYIGEYAHKETIAFLSKYDEFSEEDIILMQDLRIKRNKSSYEGKEIESIYLEVNKKKFEKLIEKLKELMDNKLREEEN